MKNSRPYVSVKKDNNLEELINALDKNMDKIKAFDQIAGIMLDGGMSRGYADYLSEIDVVIFLHKDAYENYNLKKTPIALGITMLDGYLYDVKTVNYEEELKRDYDSTTLWDLSYAKIIYDNNGELKSLFEMKLKKESEVSQAERLMFDVWWNYRLAGDIWIHREDILQGHYCFNNAVKPLISSLFIANKEYIPHDKWLIHMSRTLEWKPLNYDRLLKDIFSTGDMSLESLYKRQESIESLWNSIDIQLCRMIDFNNGLKLMHRGAYQILKRAVDKGIFTIEEWNKFSSIANLNFEPLFSISEIKDGKVILNKDKMNALGENDMYFWFLDIVKAIRQGDLINNKD
ncbi:DUF4037 domain-containing protein [Anaerocolumna sedimenticola]|uniref:DUF4037 domain-containing protein n=1 Tax=Anaerocolumna sedimenticola TaxID=2696063 RepID=A0A6P1TJZ8_9FIRM|nr:DUF4037 domain-containing protein [Anaerocolumna sedimenticola]QHQ60617.1 DUF4037 domain-containing protein [Anaerocolumna sedimenticola]